MEERPPARRPAALVRRRRTWRGRGLAGLAAIAAVGSLGGGCGGAPLADDPHPTAPATVRWPAESALHRGGNLLLVLSDTHRYDRAAPLAEGWSATPHLELLARRGVRFTDASTPVPISAPAYASLFSGLSPVEHGVLNNEQRLAETVPLLAEQLRDLGYQTAAVVGNPFCSSGHGFGRGFDHFWDEVEGQGKDGAVLTDEALRWLESRDPTRPFFLFVAYMDAHTPYVTAETPPSLLVEVEGQPMIVLRAEDAHRLHSFDLAVPPGSSRVTLTYLNARGEAAQPPADRSPLYLVDLQTEDPRLSIEHRGLHPVAEAQRYLQMSNRVEIEIHNRQSGTVRSRLRFRVYRRYEPEETPALYDAGVRHFDRQLGRLVGRLEAAGLADATTVVFVSDHGEMLGEHGAWGHVKHLWQETLRIPLIVKGPGIPAGVEFPGPFDLLDLHRLVLILGGGAAGSEATFPFSGGATDVVRVAAVYPPEAPVLQIALRRGDDKLVLDADGGTALYDLSSDPREQENLFDRRRDEARIRRLITLGRREMAAVLKSERLDLESLDRRQIDRLRALGYLE